MSKKTNKRLIKSPKEKEVDNLSTSKGCFSGEEVPGMTRAESEVYLLLTRERMTPAKIANRRGKSRQSTYKIIKKLKEKGFLKLGLQKVDKSRGTPSNKVDKSKKIRLHGQEFNLRILWKDGRYSSAKKKANFLNVDGNSIKLYNDSLEVYSGRSFWGFDARDSTSQSLKYWIKIFARLENDLNILLLKDRSQNIKLVKAHYAEVDSEIAKDYELKNERLSVKAAEDGKLWLIVDNSFNLRELETVHPQTSQNDMVKVQKQVNDWRLNDPPTMSQVMGVIGHVLDINKETAAGLNSVVKLIGNGSRKDQDPVIQKSLPEYIG